MIKFDFNGKVALVTGGGSGIGESCAATFAGAGAKVAVVDFDRAGGERVVSAIKGKGGSAVFINADVGKPDQVESMLKQTVEVFGRLNIAVNNAGIGGESNPVGDYSVEDWLKVIGINLNGVFYCMRYEIPQMLKNGGGVVVNMSSILGSVGFANSAAYVAAKHGIVGLTQSAAIEYSGRGIRVNAVGPGFILTPLLSRNLDEASQKAIAGMHPIGRMGTPQEVADLVAFLSSDEASFITGSYYTVDGAYTAQ